VDHKILCSILEKKIKDKKVMQLIEIILKNHKTQLQGKGMPLGNLTSQFFANVFLNELDQFVKHKLKAKHYIRYVDDFVILHHNKNILYNFKKVIESFCTKSLALQLHPDKSKVLNLETGVGFLGFRLYQHHKRIKKKSVKRFERKMVRQRKQFNKERITREKVVESFEGWLAHISHANTFKYKKHLVRMFNSFFPLGEPIQKHNLTKHQNFLKKSEESELKFSVQQTHFLFKKGKTVEEIARFRNIKINTVWDHFANLIEYNQLSIWKILPHEKIKTILSSINSETDTLKIIKQRVKDDSITYNEINCVLAYVKSKNRVKNILYHINWYKKNHCLRKCYFNKNQRKICFENFDTFLTCNTNLAMKRKDFLDFFNNYLTICVLPEKEMMAYISWKQFQLIKSVKRNF
ncbi:MAG: helix-turn-helix domain-containing protein, partial [Nanoarchaeota archaeon]|nr:helix-turn-helix domain-containing protein [Nanoarchaeota archaeon]